MTYARHEYPSSSVVTASDRCTEGHGFDSCQGFRFFSLSHARDMLIIPSFLISLTILSLGWGNKCLPPEFFTFPKIFLEAIWCDRVTSLFVSGWKKITM